MDTSSSNGHFDTCKLIIDYSVHQCFGLSITFKGGKTQWSPLHIAAERGNLQLCKYIVKMTGDKQLSRKDSLTLFYLAAGKGHFQVCTFIMKNLENKNTANKRGNTISC